MTMIRDIMLKARIKDVAESIGAICDECNTEAFYFNTKNNDFYTQKRCLICEKESSRGLILEDFIFTLNRHIANHYILDENANSNTVSLKSVLKRFTYDNEIFLDKLAGLLCDKNDVFFKKDGFYRSVLDEKRKSEFKIEVVAEWNSFAKELKHNKRFTNTKAFNFYNELVSSCIHKLEENKPEFNEALKTIERGSVFYRGRLIKNDVQKNAILSNPPKEMSAPPASLATNSRMSPPGVSFMYMASDDDTAIAELRPYVNDTVAIARFVSKKDLKFFDFTELVNIKHSEPHILDNPKDGRWLKNRYITSVLHDLISTPLRANDISYIESQMFAEVIRNYHDGVFDGVIFKSSQNTVGVNYVIFGEHSNEEEMTKNYHVDFDCDTGVKLYKVNKVVISKSEAT